jgi:uncharacterized protein YjdB
MTWISSDESIVSTTVDKNGNMHLKGANIGDASVTGTTEDGGFQATLPVTVGDFDHGLNYLEFNFDDKGNFWLKVRNDTNLVITQITAELYMYNALDGDNPPVPINTKDGSNKVEIIWTGTLNPGETTGKNHWKMVNYQLPEGIGIYDTRGSVTVCSYQIDHDWIKTIRQSHRKPKDY